MRITCLTCGHQVPLAPADRGDLLGTCACGASYRYPLVLDTGVRPNARAAERARTRAFRSAGLVRNLGGFALGVAALGLLFFPLGLVGALLGIYGLTMVRGPLARYTGRAGAVAAIVLGSLVFGVGSNLTLSWLQTQRLNRLARVQEDARADLQALVRAQRLYRATYDRFGSFAELQFSPPSGRYTLYLAPDDLLPGRCDGQPCSTPLPPGVVPGHDAEHLRAVAVTHIDVDAHLDAWTVTEAGAVVRLGDDD